MQLFKCHTCNKSFSGKYQLKRHLKTHSGVKPFPCTFCGFKFAQKNSLTVHVSSRHTGNTPHKCEYCGKCCASNYQLQQHLNIHKGVKPYQCPTCKRSFRYKQQLQNHQNRHAGIRPLKCHLCEKAFVYDSELKTHLNYHRGIKPYQCDQCPKKFSQHCHWTAHRRVHMGVKPFKCDLCPQTFTQSSQLQSHRRSHTGDKPHQCTVCGQRFRLTHTLNCHQRTHTGERPYKCPMCPMAFTQSSPLNLHLKNIHGKDTFSCPTCHKEFPTVIQVTVHQKIHTEVNNKNKRFTCIFCDKGWVKKADLFKHIRSHTEEKVFNCSGCDNWFAGWKGWKACENSHIPENMPTTKSPTGAVTVTPFKQSLTVVPAPARQSSPDITDFPRKRPGTPLRSPPPKKSPVALQHQKIPAVVTPPKSPPKTRVASRKPAAAEAPPPRSSSPIPEPIPIPIPLIEESESAMTIPESDDKPEGDRKDDEFPCNICGKVMRHQTQLKKHMATHKNKPKNDKKERTPRTPSKSPATVTSLQSPQASSLKSPVKEAITESAQVSPKKYLPMTPQSTTSPIVLEPVEPMPIPIAVTIPVAPPTTSEKSNEIPTVQSVGQPKKKFQCHVCKKVMKHQNQVNGHMNIHKRKRKLKTVAARPNKPPVEQLKPPVAVTVPPPIILPENALPPSPPMSIEKALSPPLPIPSAKSPPPPTLIPEVKVTDKPAAVVKTFQCKICGLIMKHQNQVNGHMNIHKFRKNKKRRVAATKKKRKNLKWSSKKKKITNTIPTTADANDSFADLLDEDDMEIEYPTIEDYPPGSVIAPLPLVNDQRRSRSHSPHESELRILSVRHVGPVEPQKASNFRPFQCEFCNKMYKTKEEMGRHMEIHQMKAAIPPPSPSVMASPRVESEEKAVVLPLRTFITTIVPTKVTIALAKTTNVSVGKGMSDPAETEMKIEKKKISSSPEKKSCHDDRPPDILEIFDDEEMEEDEEEDDEIVVLEHKKPSQQNGSLDENYNDMPKLNREVGNKPGGNFHSQMKVEQTNVVVNVPSSSTSPIVSCDICQRSFGNRGTYANHMNKAHKSNQPGPPVSSLATEEKKYKCILCNYVTKDSSSLTDHARTVHYGKCTHKCSFCWKSFRTDEQLGEHVQKSHKYTTELDNNQSNDEDDEMDDMNLSKDPLSLP